MATSSGWSAAGGPWVEPDDAMKKVVWSETVVEGGGASTSSSPPFLRSPGPSRTARAGARRIDAEWSTDWVVVALPASAAHDVAASRPTVSASASVDDWSPLVDGSFDARRASP